MAPSKDDVDNIQRLKFEQLSAEHQKALDDIKRRSEVRRCRRSKDRSKKL